MISDLAPPLVETGEFEAHVDESSGEQDRGDFIGRFPEHVI